jgi:hypothetical protein
MDVEFHSEIGTPHTTIEVMNHIKVLLKSTGRSEYFLFQDDECVMAMISVPPGEIMGRVHIADQSDKAPALKVIDAWTWKGYPANKFLGYNHVPKIALSVYRSSASHLMTNPRDGASQLLNASTAKRSNESISQKQREELLAQIVSGVYDPSNVVDYAVQEENRNPYVRYPVAQTLGIEKVVPSPDIPEVPASPCNIIHCEPINCKSKLYLESPLAECDVDCLLKNQNTEVHRMLSPGQNGYRLQESPVTASPSVEQRESRPFNTSRQPSSRIPSSPIRSGRSACCERKSRHDMAGFAKGMATTSGWTLVLSDCRNPIHQVRQR